MAHPAFGDDTTTTSTLLAAFTVLEPGDRARPHRHTGAAIRFATRAEGAATIVNGRRCEMQDGDLILTPPMCWHGHINDSDHRIIWFDAANMPLIRAVDAHFFEPGDPRNNEFWQVDAGEEDAVDPGRAGGPRRRKGHGELAEISLSRSRNPGHAGARAGRPRRRAHHPLRQSRHRRRGDADTRLLRGAARRQGADAAQARDLQHDLSRRLRERPLDHRRQDLRMVAARRLHRSALDLGRSTRRPMARPTCFWSPTSRRSSASISCARSCNRPMGATGIGAPLRRIEDPPLLRGQGRYVADIDVAGALHCVLVRSPHAHARILRIDTTAALPTPRRRRSADRRRHGDSADRADASAVGDPFQLTARRWRSRRALPWRAMSCGTSASRSPQ